MRQTLTPRQIQVLTVIITYIDEHGFSPTFAEIGVSLDISRVTVWEHICALERKGVIRRERNKDRSIAIVAGVFIQGSLEDRIRKKLEHLRAGADENDRPKPGPFFSYEDGVRSACAAIEGVLDA